VTQRRYTLPDVLLRVSSQGTNTETLAANKTLTIEDARIQFLDPNGVNRKVISPTEADSDGIIFWIINIDSTATLSVYASDGITLLAIVNSGETGIFVCDGTSWTAGPVTAGPSVPSNTAMWFYQDTAPLGWSIIAAADSLLAVKGGSQAYNVAGGNNAGTWTQPVHSHTGPSHKHTVTLPKDGWSGSCCFNGRVYDVGVSTTDARTLDSSYSGTGSTGGGATSNIYRPKAYVGILARRD